MSDRAKLISMLGMAYKARKTISGDESLRKSIRDQKVKLVIIAEDASDNTKKRFINSAKYYKINYYIVLTKAELSKSSGTNNRAVIGIIDLNFSTTIEKLIINLQSKTGGDLNE